MYPTHTINNREMFVDSKMLLYHVDKKCSPRKEKCRGQTMVNSLRLRNHRPRLVIYIKN